MVRKRQVRERGVNVYPRNKDGTARFQTCQGIPPELMRSMELFGKTRPAQLTSHTNTFIGYSPQRELTAAAILASVLDGEVVVPLGVAFAPGVDRSTVLPLLLERGFIEERAFARGLTHLAFQVKSRAEWEAVAGILSSAPFPGPDLPDPTSLVYYPRLLDQFGLMEHGENFPQLSLDLSSADTRSATLDAWWANQLVGGSTLTCLGRYQAT